MRCLSAVTSSWRAQFANVTRPFTDPSPLRAVAARLNWPTGLRQSRPLALIPLAFFLVATMGAAAQTGQWIWMGGSSSAAQGGVYGTQGSPAAGNIPGARSNAVVWTDTEGNVWLQGGCGYDALDRFGELNDLWKFDPSTNEWTWIGGMNIAGEYTAQGGVYGKLGTPSSTNQPGARNSAVGWIDNNHNLWLLGGNGFDVNRAGGYLSDMWRYNPANNEWGWMTGPDTVNQPGVYGALTTPATASTPGGRYLASTWTDANGNLWLFGGYGYDAGGDLNRLNDLWRFNPSTGEWTWMGGLSTAPESGGVHGMYGVMGIPSSYNFPGSRDRASSWTDESGNLWLFGGEGFDAYGDMGDLNDLWKFDPSSNEWTWMGGSEGANQWGVGVLGFPGVLNIPSSRQDAATALDGNGQLWLFGGGNIPNTNSAEIRFNDLWEFDPSTNSWTWMSGNTNANQPGVYGKLHTAASGNLPGSRDAAVMWIDSAGRLWLFGGYGYDAAGKFDRLNDLWVFQPYPPAVQPTFVTPVPGSYAAPQSVTISDATPGAAIYYTADGSSPNTESYLYTGPFTVSSTETIHAVAFGGGHSASPLAAATYTITSATTPFFSPAAGTYASVQTVSIYDDNNGVTIYYTTDGSSPTTVSARYTGPIAVAKTETIRAIASGGGYSASPVASAAYTIQPPSAASQIGNWVWLSGSSQFNQRPLYGTLQVSSPLTNPGSVSGAAFWTDNSGNLWLFDGDVWKFNPASMVWTWMAGPAYTFRNGIYGTLGTPSPDNVPGSRGGSVTWKDNSGNFWLFGGEGADSLGKYGYLNDLWMFSPSTLEWTWMGGSNVLPTCPSTNSCGPPGVYGSLHTPSPDNVPPGRSDAQGWTDANGDFWLFGGRIYIVYLNGWGGYENDLWKYSPSTKEWTWMGGASSLPSNCTLNDSCGYAGVYGNRLAPSTSNLPGAREDSTTWTDSSGHFWLMGGFGYDSAHIRGYLNDLWKFNPAAGTWEWVSGSKTVGAQTYDGPAGIYGTKGSPSPTNVPGGREYAASWVDQHNNLWLFGGYGYGSDISQGYFSDGYLNDLWEFNPATNEWTWMNGSNLVSGLAVFGPLGVASSANDPGNRAGIASWSDNSGNLWFFGGNYFMDNYDDGALNDVWEYLLNGPPHAQPPSFSLSPNNYTGPQSVMLVDATPNATYYYTTDGSTPTVSSTPYTGPISITTTQTVNAIAIASGFAESPVASATYNITPATPVITWRAPAPITYGTALSAIQLDATTYAPGTFTYNPPAGTVVTAGLQTLIAKFVPDPNSGYNVSEVSVTLTVYKATPAVTWATPAPITYGTALTSTQLDATSTVPGIFAYSPAAGTVLGLGTHTLKATFTPTDSADYLATIASVTLTVGKAIPAIAWPTPAAIAYGTPLSSAQLNATVTGVTGKPLGGTLAYTPSAGTILDAGSQKLSVTFTPTDSTDYAATTATVTLTVNKATPAVTWSTPAPISYGTALTSTQLDASSTVAGSFAYSPAAGTVLSIGTHTLKATFTPTDTADYAVVIPSVTLTVNQATPTITWPAPAPIASGTPLSSTQLNATVTGVTGKPLPGTVTYNPPAGTVLSAGQQTLTVSFTPTDTTDYKPATASVTITVQ